MKGIYANQLSYTLQFHTPYTLLTPHKPYQETCSQLQDLIINAYMASDHNEIKYKHVILSVYRWLALPFSRTSLLCCSLVNLLLKKRLMKTISTELVFLDAYLVRLDSPPQIFHPLISLCCRWAAKTFAAAGVCDLTGAYWQVKRIKKKKKGK